MSSSTQTPPAPKFRGEVCHKIEGKNRITIPVAWRFGVEVTLFMIQKSDKACVSVMTQAEMERLERQADGLSPMERSEFLEMLGGDVREVSMDKGGRISLPEDFFALLGLPDAREVWLAGATDTFNIWSLKNFAENKAKQAARNYASKQLLGI